MKSEDYIQWLQDKGVTVGEGTCFFDPAKTEIDIQRPWMLKIGKYCKITAGVSVLCHDYSRSVLRRTYGEVIGEAGETIIGDNVFLGRNAIVLMGSKIGDNVIIGAGSVVTGEIPANTVAAGNPARVICTLEEYYNKRKSLTANEAELYAGKYYDYYGRYPNEKEMGPFWQLFMPRDLEKLREKEIFTRLGGDDEGGLLDAFMKTEPQYEGYSSFIEHVKASRE